MSLYTIIRSSIMLNHVYLCQIVVEEWRGPEVLMRKCTNPMDRTGIQSLAFIPSFAPPLHHVICLLPPHQLRWVHPPLLSFEATPTSATRQCNSTQFHGNRLEIQDDTSSLRIRFGNASLIRVLLSLTMTNSPEHHSANFRPWYTRAASVP